MKDGEKELKRKGVCERERDGKRKREREREMERV
jgi:hypothetical protein